MRQQLWATACLTLTSLFYHTTLPSTFIPTSFLIGLSWMPLLTAIILAIPSQGILVRNPAINNDKAWFPHAFQTSHVLVMTLFGYFASSDMDLALDVNGSLAADFEIFLTAEAGYDFLWKVVMSGAAVAALEAGKMASFGFVPLFERLGLFEWRTGVVERTAEEERKLDEWWLRPEREGFRSG